MSLYDVMMAGVKACEQFVAEDKAMTKAWYDGVLEQHLKQLRETAVNEYGRDDSAGTGTTG